MNAAPRVAPAPDRAPRIEPWDEHNRRLVQEVHPPDWTNPEPRGRYHLVVIGAGTGGLVSAAIAASLGAKVALVERHLMGGDCLNTGCVPSKALLRAARSWAEARASAARFGGPEASGTGDFAAAMERLRRLRADIAEADGAARFRDLGADVFLGDASFTGPETVEVAGTTLRFRRAVIATGARAAAPAIPGLEEAGYLTNETLFSLAELPERMVVIGAGPIGCEMAQAFARFGSHVTLLDAADRPLPREEPGASEILRRAMERDGVRFIGGSRITRVERVAGVRRVRFEADGLEDAAEGDALLVAAGRRPNVEGLGLEAAGVVFDPRRGIEVDARLRTSNRRVYAVGDVASQHPFTHTADAQARIAVPNALFHGRSRADRLVVPWCTYTSPEVARVGLSADEAAEKGVEIDTVTIPLGEVDRARLEGAEEGFVRLHLKRGSDTIVGATIVAEHAGDLIAQVAQAMTLGYGLGRIGSVIFPYPTVAEALRKAADRHRRRKLTPRVRSLFDLFFRLTG